MDILSTSTRRSEVEQRPRGASTSALLVVRDGGMAVLAMLLAVTFANLVCG